MMAKAKSSRSSAERNKYSRRDRPHDRRRPAFANEDGAAGEGLEMDTASTPFATERQRNGDDEDNRSVLADDSSTASTLSYIHSILERRRVMVLPSNVVGGDDPRSRPSLPHRSTDCHYGARPPIEDTSRRRRPKRRKSNDALLALSTIVGLWLAIPRIILNNPTTPIPHDSGDLLMTDASDRQGEGESPHDGLWVSSMDTGRVQFGNPQHGRGTDDKLASRTGSEFNKFADEDGSEGPWRTSAFYGTDAIAESSSLTERFMELRHRLSSLYSQAVPSEAPGDSSDQPIFLHPLYDFRSSQFKALFWLANVDGLRLRHYDPGLVQRYVLAVLYFSTGGPPVFEDTDLSKTRKGAWRSPTNFLSPTHECEWKSRIMDGAGRGGGIRSCDRNKTIVEISLYNELTGTIPTEIGQLRNLRTLYLGRNHLTGTIPTELGMIQKLSSLSLQWNDLSGTIPEHYLKNLLQLKALQIEGNDKLIGKIRQHNLLCQMRNKYHGPLPQDQEKYVGRRTLRIFTATCVPLSGSDAVSDRLECACCTECFGKTTKDLLY